MESNNKEASDYEEIAEAESNNSAQRTRIDMQHIKQNYPDAKDYLYAGLKKYLKNCCTLSEQELKELSEKLSSSLIVAQPAPLKKSQPRKSCRLIRLVGISKEKIGEAQTRELFSEITEKYSGQTIYIPKLEKLDRMLEGSK